MDTHKNMAHASEHEAARVIVERYLDMHGNGSYTWRAYHHGGIYRRSNYRYLADLKHLLPEAPLGSYSYIWGVYEAKSEQTLRFAMFPYGPVSIYVNGTLYGSSDIFSERYRSKQLFDLPMHEGFNDVVLVCENTSGGFGCEFGTWVGKLDYYFHMPSIRSEQEGLLYSEPVQGMLGHLDRESLVTISWLPEKPSFSIDALDYLEVFPNLDPGQFVLAYTQLDLVEGTWVSFASEAEIFVDGKLARANLELPKGKHGLVAIFKEGDGTEIQISDGKSGIPLILSNPVLGESSPYCWLLSGPFDDRPEEFALQFSRPFAVAGAQDFWHLQGQDMYLRIYNDNALFGHWNYPLGVTLYGLAETERMFRDIDPDLSGRISSYLTSHVQSSLDTYDYAMWDKQTLGGATAVHHLMTSLDSLDDCGSFGSTVLEIAKDHGIEGYGDVVGVVGYYISKLQPRLSDGTFFRTGLMHEFHENTLWADDLYMSVPFLCRFSAFKKDASYLDDAAKQFFGFAKYLYMEEEKLMSHVYDFERNLATGIPWGRGNGWTLFSLSELLMVLPPEHPKRDALLRLFRDLSEGYLALQDESGIFHQVLNMKASYPESSCTAMFACSFSRGVRFGWYEDPSLYAEGCKRACDALKEQAIDQEGHVWGVCRGSEFSCSAHYYAEQLLPRLDDTHGIGIILLALCEGRKLANL